MAVSAVFDLIDAFIDKAREALPTTAVYDGYPDTDAPGAEFVCVGIPDPLDESEATSASAQQAWAHANHTARDEEGDLFCVAAVTNGDGDPRAARASLKAMLAAVETMLRTDYTLGVSSVLWTSYGTSTDLMQDQGPEGAVAQVTFSIHYRARI